LGGFFQQGFARIILGNEFVAGFRAFALAEKSGYTDDLAIKFFTGKGASVKLGGVLGFLENGLSNMKWYLALVERGGIIGKFFGGINAAFTKVGLFPARAILKPLITGGPLPFIGGFAGDMFGRFLNSTILSSINLGYAGGFLNAVGWSTLGTGVGIGAAAAIAGGSFFVAAPVLIIGGALVGITYVVSIFTGNGIPWVDTWLAKIFGGAGGLSAFAQFSFFFQITRIWASITKGDFLQLVISYFNLLMTISAMGIPLIIVTTTIMPAYTPGATDNMAIGSNIPNSTWAFEEYGADIADATNAASSSIVYDEAKYGPLDNCTAMRYPMRQKYAVTAGFPTYPDGGKHGGVDFGVPLGNDILASCPGIVLATNTGSPNTYGCTEAGPRCFYGYGNVVKLLVRYQDRMYEIYTAHLSSVKVNAGDKIEKGQILGLSGNSGNSSGPHLHFEIRPAGTYNPLQPCGFIDCTGNSIDNSSDSDVAKTYTLAEIASAGYGLEVSNTKCLPSDYAPSDLRTVGVSSNPNSNRLRIDAARALESMFEDAKQKGVTLYLRSAYRSYDQQQVSYGAYGDELAAKPGCSEHQLGLAVDILGGANCDFDDNPTQGFSSCNRGAYAYLQQNASKYGFTLSYPIGNSQYRYEPWHYRYR
jgi:LAS superfamily LD-carboxypeptidase LdcB